MSDEAPEDVVELAEKYLGSLDEESSTEKAVKAREELKYWDEQVDEFEEETPMHEMAVEERDGWREKLNSIEAQEERREELRDELLMRASTEFAPRDDWFESKVVEALSHALTGNRQEQLLVDGYNLPGDGDDMSNRDMVPVAKTVHALAQDALGGEDRIAELWEKLDTDTQLSIVRVLAGHEESLSSSEICDELGEDGTDSPGANIRYIRGEVDVDPYYSTNDGYTLSLAGRYLWMEYGENLPEPPERGDRDKGQAVLDDDARQSESDKDGAGDVASPDEDESKTEEPSGEMDLSSFEIRE